MSWILIGVAAIVSSLVLGGICFIIWSARRRRRKQPYLGSRSVHITRVGLLAYGMFVVCLFAGLTSMMIRPYTSLGLWLRNHDLVMFMVILVIPFTVVAVILHRCGYPLHKERNDSAV